VSSTNSRGAGGLSAQSAWAGLDNVDQTVAFGNTTTITARTVNELRAQVVYGDLHALPSDPIGPAVSISGIASFGTLSGSPTARLNKMVQSVATMAADRTPPTRTTASTRRSRTRTITAYTCRSCSGRPRGATIGSAAES
jgi:hypothetical protein